MRVQKFRKISAAAVVLAAGLALTACNGDDGGKPSGVSSAPSATVSSSGTTPGSGSGSAGASSSAAATSGIATGGSGNASGSATASAGPRTTERPAVPCRTAHLTFTKGTAYGKGPNSNIPVTLTNSGSAPCSLRGFPGVDLVGKDGRVRARRSVEAPHPVILAPGRSASFVLAVPQNTGQGRGVTFTRAMITPPHETHPYILWLRVNLPAKGDGPGDRSVLVGPVTR